MEKRLAALLDESAENKRKFKERKYAIRYHRIRFFERVKLERRITKLKRELANEHGAEKLEGLRSMLAQAEDDLEYVLHFPKGEKYVSILKNSQDGPEAQKTLESERKRLRILVKKQLADEAIVNEMDEGNSRAAIRDKHTAMASKGPMDDGADDPIVPTEHKEEDMADDDFFLAESSSSVESEDNLEAEVDQISLDSQPLSSSSHEEHPFDTEETEGTKVSSVPKHDGIISVEAKGTRISHSNMRTNGKAHRVAHTKNKKDVSKRQARKSAGDGETKMHTRTRKFGKKDQVDSTKVSKGKVVSKQPLRTRAEGGRKRRRK